MKLPLILCLPLAGLMLTASLQRSSAQAAQPGPAAPSSQEPPASGEPATPQVPKDFISETDAAAVHTHLDSLAEEIKTFQSRKFQSLIETFTQAAGSGRGAANFYVECKELVDYDWADKERDEFRRWEDRREDLHHNTRFGKALQVQLNYLALTLEASRSEDLTTVFPRLIDHIDEVASMIAPPGGERFVTDDDPPRQLPYQGGLEGSPFVERYDLQVALNDLENWTMNPFDVGGIYESTLLPYIRANDPQRILDAWRKRINDEKRVATAMGGKYDFNFDRLRLPELEWGMLNDEFLLNPSTSTVSRMVAHIKEHKETHPKAGEWVEELTALIASSQS